MVRDYVTQLYEPAAASGVAATNNGAAAAKQLAAWKRDVRAAWADVAITRFDTDVNNAHEHEQRVAELTVNLGQLSADAVSVELLHGPVDSEGSFSRPPRIDTMTPIEPTGTYRVEYRVGEAGTYGVAARVLPMNDSMVSRVEMGLMEWAH
jgi:starch phosphorylase